MQYVNYKGNLQKKSCRKFDKIKLYNIAVHGYGALTKSEYENLSKSDHYHIKKIFGKSQSLINKYKNQKTVEKTNKWLTTLFPNMPTVKSLLSCETELDDFNMFSFKDLGITRKEIVNLLNQNNIFKNYELQFNK